MSNERDDRFKNLKMQFSIDNFSFVFESFTFNYTLVIVLRLNYKFLTLPVSAVLFFNFILTKTLIF